MADRRKTFTVRDTWFGRFLGPAADWVVGYMLRDFGAPENESRQPRQTLGESAVLREISNELARARGKFPGDNVTFAALVEEVGELATAIFEEPRENVQKEAIQVAVMACRIILDGDHTYEPWRAQKGLDPLADGSDDA